MVFFSWLFIAFSLLVSLIDAESPTMMIVCGGEDISQKFKCNENHVLRIESATYGREYSYVCESSIQFANQSRACGMNDVFEIISRLCEGRQRCASLIANATNLEELQECRNVNQYLFGHFYCMPKKVTKKSDKQDNDHRRRRPIGDEGSKNKKTTTIIVKESDHARTGHVQFEVELEGSRSGSCETVLEISILFVLGTFYFLYY